MSDENNSGRNPPPPGGRQPLTLKPRGAGSVSAGTVKQSFSHGRSKTVVVETKRARPHAQVGGNLAGPSAAEKRLFEQGYQQPLLWWHRIVPTNKAVMGWKMSPSHNLGQDLGDVWLNT